MKSLNLFYLRLLFESARICSIKHTEISNKEQIITEALHKLAPDQIAIIETLEPLYNDSDFTEKKYIKKLRKIRRTFHFSKAELQYEINDITASIMNHMITILVERS